MISNTTITANAETSSTIKINLPLGGANKYKGEKIESKAKSILVESELIKKKYILISTDMKNISDEDLQIIYDSGFGFPVILTKVKSGTGLLIKFISMKHY